MTMRPLYTEINYTILEKSNLLYKNDGLYVLVDQVQLTHLPVGNNKLDANSDSQQDRSCT
jgi:hypothetical protein